MGLDPRRTDYSDVHMTEEPECIVPRDDWRANNAEKEVPLANPVSYVIVDYTRTPPCCNGYLCYESVFMMQKTALLETKIPDIPYNFIVGGTGFVFEGRGWKLQPTLPPHLSYLEDKALYVGLIGDFDSILEDEEMVEEIRDGTRYLIRYGMDHGKITKNILLYNLFWKENNLSSTKLLF